MPEIFGADDLASAARFTATQLQSGVFLSQPGGGFVFSALPGIMQVAPLQGIVAGDYDGDGHADILAVQNSHAYNQTVGRFDGGLGQFLRGDGRGNFLPVDPVDDGFLVPGDARSLAVINFDGDAWPDFFVTRNRSTSLAWQNRGTAGNKTLEVRLRGQRGNRTGIGARVTVQLTDGTVQASEVTAGSGVMSQSTNQLYFGYPRGNPPKKLKIAWPTGQTRELKLSEIPARLEISEVETP
jgi:hypothetical protein